jgi:hypothetical protein
MADTLFERVTGRSAAEAASVAVNLVISDQALMGVESSAAVIAGYGPVPAAVAQRLICEAVADSGAGATLRRLYANPSSGALVALESRSRLFPKALADFIGLRDQRCRTPYCDAPVRHRDHAKPHRKGGATSNANGLGMCERCNYVKEAAGWQVTTETDTDQQHTAEFVTPTGAHHHSTAPPMPGTPRSPLTEVEVWLNRELVHTFAA